MEGKIFDFSPQTVREILKGFAPRSNIRILEAGCGYGNNTDVIRKYFKHAEIIGIDIDNDLLQKARDNVEKVRFYNADASHLPSIAHLGTFDLILDFIPALYWLMDSAVIVQNLQRLLKPGAIYIKFPYVTTKPLLSIASLFSSSARKLLLEYEKCFELAKSWNIPWSAPLLYVQSTALNDQYKETTTKKEACLKRHTQK